MKSRYLLLATFLLLSINLLGAPIRFQATRMTQADGSIVHCFSSGDEFFNYLHDQDEYTLILGDDGFLYYAIRNEAGYLEPSSLRVGQGQPKQMSIPPRVLPSPQWLLSRRAQWEQLSPKSHAKLNPSGNLYGLVIFIRFADDLEYTSQSHQAIQDLFNSDSPKSMKNFYHKASYGKLNIDNYFLPSSDEQIDYSYQDSHQRGYYQKYNPTLNPLGYKTDNERSQREWSLLIAASKAMVIQGQIPSDSHLDSDGDGYADFVSFIISGQSQGWNDLLWAHKWQFPLNQEPQLSSNVRIGTYTFLPQSQAEQHVICHEAFHAFGAPDLYHYYTRTDISPCGAWDLMDLGTGHISAIMKATYTDWKSSEEIKQSGRYVIYPQSETDHQSMYFYQANADERIIIEYRRPQSDRYDSAIPGSGLLVFRHNRLYDGNAMYDGVSNFDEVYIFRPNGSSSNAGQISMAHLNQSQRNYFGPEKGNHYAFTTKGHDIPIEISNITDHGDSMSFDFNILDNEAVNNVSHLESSRENLRFTIRWQDSTQLNQYILCTSDQPITDTLVDRKTYFVGSKLPHGAHVIYKGSDLHFNFQAKDSSDARYFKIFCMRYDKYSKGVQTVNYQQYLYSKLDHRLPSDISPQYLTWNAPAWGSLIGHNSKNHSEFLEFYPLSPGQQFSLEAIELNVAKAIANNGIHSQIKLVVYQAHDSKPAQCLQEFQVPIADLKVGRNIIRLPDTLNLGTSFWLGFAVDYLDICDTVAIHSTLSNPSRTASLIVRNGDDYQYLNSIHSANISAWIFPLCSQKPYISSLPNDTVQLIKDQSTDLVILSHDGAPFEYNCDDTWLEISKDPIYSRLSLAAQSGTPTHSRTLLHLRHRDGYSHQLVIIAPQNSSMARSTEVWALKVYPNPMASNIHVDGLSGESQLILMDVQGRVLKTIHTREAQIQIPCTDLAPGIYILKEAMSGRSATLIKP